MSAVYLTSTMERPMFLLQPVFHERYLKHLKGNPTGWYTYFAKQSHDQL